MEYYFLLGFHTFHSLLRSICFVLASDWRWYFIISVSNTLTPLASSKFLATTSYFLIKTQESSSREVFFRSHCMFSGQLFQSVLRHITELDANLDCLNFHKQKHKFQLQNLLMHLASNSDHLIPTCTKFPKYPSKLSTVSTCILTTTRLTVAHLWKMALMEVWKCN